MDSIKHVLITGGTGSVGRAVINRLLSEHPSVERIVIYSRDEHKQGEMARDLGEHQNRLEFILGDITNQERLSQSLIGVDTVIHTAAMRLVPHAEANPQECLRTNVEGAISLVAAVRRSDVRKVVAISSDKAVAPTTIYGASKFSMERILIDADRKGTTRFSMVRYANILNSRSSVAPLFLHQREAGILTLTDPEMTRFSIVMNDGVDLIMFAAKEGWGGDVICPISPSYCVKDMAMAIGPNCEHRVVGARPGEKKHEAMFSITEAPFVAKRGQHYVVSPQTGRWGLEEYCEKVEDAGALNELFEYTSENFEQRMSVNQINEIISQCF